MQWGLRILGLFLGNLIFTPHLKNPQISPFCAWRHKILASWEPMEGGKCIIGGGNQYLRAAKMKRTPLSLWRCRYHYDAAALPGVIRDQSEHPRSLKVKKALNKRYKSCCNTWNSIQKCTFSSWGVPVSPHLNLGFSTCPSPNSNSFCWFLGRQNEFADETLKGFLVSTGGSSH